VNVARRRFSISSRRHGTGAEHIAQAEYLFIDAQATDAPYMAGCAGDIKTAAAGAGARWASPSFRVNDQHDGKWRATWHRAAFSRGGGAGGISVRIRGTTVMVTGGICVEARSKSAAWMVNEGIRTSTAAAHRGQTWFARAK